MARDDDPVNSGEGSHEEGLADLLWEYVDRLNSGEAIDAAAIRAEHPELADELLIEPESLRGWRADGKSAPKGKRPAARSADLCFSGEDQRKQPEKCGNPSPTTPEKETSGAPATSGK
jgi:hypothetical protein